MTERGDFAIEEREVLSKPLRKLIELLAEVVVEELLEHPDRTKLAPPNRKPHRRVKEKKERAKRKDGCYMGASRDPDIF